MRPAPKLALFALLLVVVFGAAFGCGSALSDGDHGNGATHADPHGDGHGGGHAMSQALHGTAATESGFTLAPTATTFAAGGDVPFGFRVQDERGQTVTSFDQLHERELHLIVVRRDLTGFQHVHPTRTSDGTWSVALALPAPGTWRAYADIDPAGSPGQLTLGTELTVTGPEATLAPANVPAADFDVSFTRTGTTIDVGVKRGGAVVTPDHYLGSRGHLVAIRRSDLGYAHVHPQDREDPTVRFDADLPAGSYRLFFDFSVDGTVRTATHDLEVA